ncbi:MAG TPA: cupin domain-containing protein [Zeimonas sp.]|nr:cupin domain-containing protein [Zeimonas sp.]
MTDSAIRKALPTFRWEGVDTLCYKAEGSAPFRDVTRQVLFGGDAMRCEWRYFEVAPGGYTTLERHEHAHAVMILRGRGQCLVGDRVHAVGERDLVAVPPLAWHQFRADPDSPLGFLCLVDTERDRPQLPGPDDLAALRRIPGVADFIRTGDEADV